MNRREIARSHVLEVLAKKGYYKSRNKSPGFYGGQLPIYSGLAGGSITDILKGAADKVTSMMDIPAGTASPGELYAEWVPRIQKAGKQYDNSSPMIDWMIIHWPTLAVSMLLGGTLAVVGGNFLYDLMKGKKKGK